MLLLLLAAVSRSGHSERLKNSKLGSGTLSALEDELGLRLAEEVSRVTSSLEEDSLKSSSELATFRPIPEVDDDCGACLSVEEEVA